MTRISNHKDFLTGEICNTAGVNLDEELIKDCSDEVIELAKQLKANNLTGVGGDREKSQKYSEKKPLTAQNEDAYDKFFISYAERMLQREFKTKYNVIYKQQAMNCEITDSQWAIYSADEILAMEQNGTVIPKDVVEWAHSQQQLDVTNYIIETDADSEDETIADNLTDTDALSVLQATAKKNINKVEKASEKIKDKQTKYEKISEEASKVKKSKEDTFKKKVEDIKTLKKEWDELNTKRENGKLSFVEQQKFNKLSKELKKSDKTLDNEMNFGSNELEDFLDELDNINADIKTNAQIAKDAISAGRALNDIDKSYDTEALPYAYTGTTLDNSGLVSAALNGLTNEEIGEVAIQKGSDLENDTNTLDNDVNSSTNNETKEFALNFTSAVQEAEDNAQNVKNDNSVDNNESTNNKEEQEQKSEAKNIQEKSKKLEYGIAGANKATIKTIASTTIDLARGVSVAKDDKSLNKELKNASKKMEVITKEVNSVNEKLTNNEMTTEAFLQELESLQAESSEDGEINATPISNQTTQLQETSAQQAQIQESSTTTSGIIEKNGKSQFAQATEKGMTIINAFENADKIVSNERQKQTENQAQMSNPEQAAEAAHKAQVQAKKIELAEKIQNLGSGKQVIATDLKSAINKGDVATKKGIKILSSLDKHNEKLETQNEKSKEDASDAVDIGIGTYAIGTGNAITGLALHSYGIGLMSNPWTFQTGLTLSIIGQATHILGTTEQIAGLTAVASGKTGKDVATVENSVISDAIGTMTKAQGILNVNVLSLDQANNTATESEATTTENNSNQVTTETQKNNTQTTQAQPLEQNPNGLLTGFAVQTDDTIQNQDLFQESQDVINNDAQNLPKSPIEEAIANSVYQNINVLQNKANSEIQPKETNNNKKAQDETNKNDTNQAINNNEQQAQANFNGNSEDNTTVQTSQAPETNIANESSSTNEEVKGETTEIKKESEQAQSNATTEQINAETTTTKENAETDTTNKTTEADSKNSNEKKEVTEKDAESAAKESKKGQQEMTAAKKEDAQNKKEVKKMSKEIKDINKSTKADEQRFQKQMQTEQKQLEKKQQELAEKQAKLAEEQSKQSETQAEIEELTQALSTASADKKPELQAQLQATNVKVVDKSAEIAQLSKEVSTITTYGTKKGQTLRRTADTYVKIARTRQKNSKKTEKTADKIYKIADTTGQIASLVGIAGNITSKIGNSLTTAGTSLQAAGVVQINYWTPFLSNPWSASLAASMIATATATQVVPGTAQIATGTTTSIVGESVALAANITNTAASLTKAEISIEQGNIAGAIMATGTAVMSGVSAGQNISQIGQLNETAAAAQSVQTAAQNATETAANEATSLSETATTEEFLKGNMKFDQTQPLSATSQSIKDSMDTVMNGTKDTTGKVLTKGAAETFKDFSKSTKFGLDDVMQIGIALQAAGSFIGSSNDGKENTRKDRKMRRFGTVTRIDAKKRTRKVNATSATASNSGNSNDSAK